MPQKKGTSGFISIKMAKRVVGSPSLTQPLLLYPGLGPVMLEQHRPFSKNLNLSNRLVRKILTLHIQTGRVSWVGPNYSHLPCTTVRS
jgi:hypothetical protein